MKKEKYARLKGGETIYKIDCFNDGGETVDLTVDDIQADITILEVRISEIDFIDEAEYLARIKELSK